MLGKHGQIILFNFEMGTGHGIGLRVRLVVAVNIFYTLFDYLCSFPTVPRNQWHGAFLCFADYCFVLSSNMCSLLNIFSAVLVGKWSIAGDFLVTVSLLTVGRSGMARAVFREPTPVQNRPGGRKDRNTMALGLRVPLATEPGNVLLCDLPGARTWAWIWKGTGKWLAEPGTTAAPNGTVI